MKVATILGARPQFIKAAPLSEALRFEGIEEVLIHTGQHYDANMSDRFFEELNLAAPKYNLRVHGLNDAEMTGRMIQDLPEILFKEKPDLVVVFGDTNTTLAGALAAKKMGIPVAHIEAGMRSYLPFQAEEINRILTDQLSDLLFVSSADSKNNLLKETYDAHKIHLCGDIMYDLFLKQAEQRRLPKNLDLSEEFALLTLHRQENVDDPIRLEKWIRALNELAQEINIICPLHPRTRKQLESVNLSPAFQIIEPCSHAEILGLAERAEITLTDSGGLQKEVYFSEKPCLTLREATEWADLVAQGANLLCTPDNLVSNFKMMRGAKLDFPPLLGDGNSAKCIAQTIREYLS